MRRAALLLVLALLCTTLAPGAAAAWSPAASRAPADVTSPAQILLSRITPGVVGPHSTVTITGTVRNLDSLSVAKPRVQVAVADRTLGSRAAVAAWSTGTDTGVVGPVMASTSLAHPLRSGALARFTVRLHTARIDSHLMVATFPVTVRLVDAGADGQDRGSTRTFLPYFYPGGIATVLKHPVRVSWLVPLTLPPDPALFGYAGRTRLAAWRRAIGPGSTLQRELSATRDEPVTYLLDPAAVAPAAPVSLRSTTARPPTPAPGQSGTSASSSSSGAAGSTATRTTSAADPVRALATSLARQLRRIAPREPLWSLPYADPDVSSLVDLPDDHGVLSRLSAIRTPTSLGKAVQSGVAWPASGALNSSRIDQLRARWAGTGPVAAITSADTLPDSAGGTSDAARKSVNGLPLLAYDDDLSALFAATSDQGDGATIVQRFLAETLGSYQQNPDVVQRMLVMPPRGFMTSTPVLRALFDGVRVAPWIQPVHASALLSAARHGPAETVQAHSGAPSALPGDPTAYPVPDPTVLDQDAVDGATAAGRDVRGVSSVLDRTSGRGFRTLWSDADNQLMSTRWRSNASGWTSLRSHIERAVRQVSRGVSVSVSNVNLFATDGVLQLTVVNNLNQPVHNLRLDLTPRRDGLTVSGTRHTITIGARSRTTVRVRIQAVAAGLVPVTAQLRSIDGTPFGRVSTLQVHVTPTSTWIFWVLGGLAALILALGIYRTIRRPVTPRSAP